MARVSVGGGREVRWKARGGMSNKSANAAVGAGVEVRRWRAKEEEVPHVLVVVGILEKVSKTKRSRCGSSSLQNQKP